MANKLSIHLGIPRAKSTKERERIQKRRAKLQVFAAAMTFVTNETRWYRAHHFSYALERDLRTSCWQSRGMNSRLGEEISSSSRHNSYPTNIAKLRQKERERKKERFTAFHTSPPIPYNRDSLRWKEINAIHECIEQQNVIFRCFHPGNIVRILFLICEHTTRAFLTNWFTDICWNFVEFPLHPRWWCRGRCTNFFLGFFVVDYIVPE